MGTEIKPTAIRMRQNRSMLPFLHKGALQIAHGPRYNNETLRHDACESQRRKEERESRETGKPVTRPSDKTCVPRKRN